jgi:queuine tRNA-ribosyltransferase catalytic subunit
LIGLRAILQKFGLSPWPIFNFSSCSVGYPLDLVVCTALGVDMYDCVYPTRTARFGVALVSGVAPGTLRLKGNDCVMDTNVIEDNCICQACRRKISRATLARLFKANNPVGVELLTQHNIAYMMKLVRSMRDAIIANAFQDYVKRFITMQYPGMSMGGEDIPRWVIDALQAAGIDLADHDRRQSIVESL